MRVTAALAVVTLVLALAHVAAKTQSVFVHSLLQTAAPVKAVGISASRSRLQRLMSIRGGVIRGKLEDVHSDDDGDDDDEEENGSEEDEDEDDDSEEDEDISIADFSENTVVKYATHMYENTPPVSRLYLGSCIAITLWAWLFNSNMFPRSLAFDLRRLLKGLQYWRLITPFLSLGPLSVNFLLNLNFMWTYMAQVERLHARHPEDFAVLLSFGMLSLVWLHTVLSISYRHLGAALGVYLSYIFGRVHQGQDTLLFGIFPVKVEHVPFIFMAISLVVEQEIPVLDIAGLVLGHFYLVGQKTGLLKSPALLTNLMSADVIKKQYAKFVSQMA